MRSRVLHVSLSLALLTTGCGSESSTANERPLDAAPDQRPIAADGSTPSKSDASTPGNDAGFAPDGSQSTDANQPPANAIDPADILMQAQADHPFSDGEWNKAWNTQCMNLYLNADEPELEYPGGITGPALADGGGTVRFGKTDPTLGTQSLQFVTAPTDPTTSGRKRCEIKGPAAIVYGEVYWVAFRVYLDDWTSVIDKNEAFLFGTQMHTSNSADTSPFVSLNGFGSAPDKFQVSATWQKDPEIPASWDTSGSIGTWKSEPFDLPFNQWLDFVLQFKTDIGASSDPADGDGFIRVWMNDNPSPIVTRQGKVGYQTGVNDYSKFGYYNWSDAFAALSSDHWRKILMRSPILVRDNGSYGKDDLLSYIRQH